MSKAVKKMMIDEIRGRLGDRRDLVMLDASRLDGVEANKLRLGLQEKGITLLTVKNTLARLALRESGFESLDGVMEGPTTLVWGGEDIVGLSREMADWAKKIDSLEIKGGAVDGQVVDAASVTAISKGPSRLELIGQIAGLLLSPGAQLAGALLGPGGTISGQLKAMSEKEEEAASA